MLGFLIVWGAVCVVALLFAARFFHSWEGHAVSIRPPASPDPAVYTVLVVLDAGEAVEVEWPAHVVKGLMLPVDAAAVPPTTIPEERPRTRKSRYQLHFLVERPDEGWRSVPTTTPQALGLAVVLFLLGLGVRNMIRSGSPFSIVQRDTELPRGLAPTGAPAASGARRTKKGPPPPKKRRGKRS